VQTIPLIDKIFWYRIWKIREIKHFAKEKNIPVWQMPVIDSVMLCFLGSIYASSYIIEALPTDGWFGVVSPYLPLIIFTLAFLTVMDTVAKGMVLVHSFLTKSVYRAITKLDYILWKRTKKNNMASEAIWKVQMKYMNLPKPVKRRLKILFVLLIILYVVIRLS
jgi:hypothetical protein